MFTLLSLNCQSLFAKFDQLQIYLKHYVMSGCKFSLICLQATWLSAEHDTSMLHLDGYKFVYKPKSGSLHGGVAFNVSDTISYNIVPVAHNKTIWDGLFIELILPNAYNDSKFIVGNIYRPPRGNLAS